MVIGQVHEGHVRVADYWSASRATPLLDLEAKEFLTKWRALDGAEDGSCGAASTTPAESSEAEAEAEGTSEPASEGEAESEAEPEGEAESEAEGEAESEGEAETEVEPETGPLSFAERRRLMVDEKGEGGLKKKVREGVVKQGEGATEGGTENTRRAMLTTDSTVQGTSVSGVSA
jgi:hypothetical protein